VYVNNNRNKKNKTKTKQQQQPLSLLEENLKTQIL